VTQDTRFFKTISKYFMSTELSDIEIHCHKEIFPIHKFILGSKNTQFYLNMDLYESFDLFTYTDNLIYEYCLPESSPVFAKMFEHNLKESKDNFVEIVDAKPESVREMLKYFYTGIVGSLSMIDTKLYKLADKYMVDDLKFMCEQSMVQGVRKENVLKLFRFGHLYQIISLMIKTNEKIVE